MFFRATLPFVAPLSIGDDTLPTRDTALILLSTDDSEGLGEAAAPLGSSHELLAGPPAELRSLAQRLMALDFSDDLTALNGSLDALNSVTGSAFIRCGLEMALLNLTARRHGNTLADVLSSSASSEIRVNALITDIARAVGQAIRLVDEGYGTLKLKVGRTDIEEEARAVRRVRAAVGNDVALRLDANRAWTCEHALRFADMVHDLKIEYIEEPCRDLDETSRFMQTCDLPVAYDESLAKPDMVAISNLPTPAAFVLKPTLLGGFERCAALTRFARGRGAKAVISSYYESGIGIGALAQFAAAYGSPGVAHGLETLSRFARETTTASLKIVDGSINIEHAHRVTQTIDKQHLVLLCDTTCGPAQTSAKTSCLISQCAADKPELRALVADRVTFTYAQLHGAINRWSVFLRKCGVASGTRVAIIEPNRFETVILLWALWRIGAAATLVDPRLPVRTIAASLKLTNTKIRMVFAAGSSALNLPVETITVPPIDVVHPEHEEHTAIDLTDDATIMFPSGSSGSPKAVLHTLANHFNNASSRQTRPDLTERDSWLLSLPLFHVGGLAILWRCACARAAVVVADPGDELAAVALENRVTHLSVVSTQLRRVLQNDDALPRLRRQIKAILLGGGPTSSRLMERARDAGLPVYTTYGSTEMASQIATGNRAHPDRPTVIPGRHLKIGPDDEIFVKGSVLFRGYINEDGIDPAVDAAGWFHTGDIGRIEPDHTLVVLGRKDNMFISGGENIHPEQIEAALERIDGISQAVVVPVDDPEFGQRPVAFVRYDYDWMLQDEEEYPMSANAIRYELEQTLPRFMLPVALYPWPESYRSNGLKADRGFFTDLARRLRHL